MKKRIKKKVSDWLRLIPPAIATIVGWEIGKYLFK